MDVSQVFPHAYNQLRQAAFNYQLQQNAAAAAAVSAAGGGGGGGGGGGVPFVGMHPYGARLDPMLGFCAPRFIHEEPKPQHSYIGLIAMGILSVPDQKMVLSDIYQWIQDNYPYFRTRGPGWRNSIRHNLSLNDCFVKAGRSANGKGHYWAIHVANIEDFKKGDFRRRRAQRKVRKHLGLSVGEDDEDSDDSQRGSPLPAAARAAAIAGARPPLPVLPSFSLGAAPTQVSPQPAVAPKKRAFDVESLLADDAAPKLPVADFIAQTSPVFAPFSPTSMFELGGAGGWQGLLAARADARRLMTPAAVADARRSPSSPDAAAQWKQTWEKISARGTGNKHRQPYQVTAPAPITQ